MKKYLMWLWVVPIVLILSGCSRSLPAVSTEATRNSNIFLETTAATVPNTFLESTSQASEEDDLGSLGLSVYQEDLNSPPPEIRYEGGEMSIKFSLDGYGRAGRNGVGILLFLDGRPQPYRLEGDTDYQYMHRFTLNNEMIYPIFYFTPVTGLAGDTLEMAALTIPYPDYLPSKEDPKMMTGTHGSFGLSFPLQMDATPVETKMPEKLTLLSEPEITYEPCAPQDVLGWENDDFQIKYGHESEVNGMTNGLNVFENFHKEALDLKYSLWGTTLVHYTVVYFLNNEPLYLPDGSCLDLEVQEGMKTVARLTMDTSTLTGEDVVYAVLVPRNARFTTPKTDAFVVGERTWFLLAGEDPNK